MSDYKDKDKEAINSYQNTQINTDKDNNSRENKESRVKNSDSKTTDKTNLSISPYQSFGMMNEVINNNILFIDKSKLLV